MQSAFGSAVPHLGPVAKGSIESCWTTPGYHTGKYPVLAFFSTVPFGRRQPDARRDLRRARTGMLNV
jgi:TRAP-type mannitol/chloroaromatic compound transport system substrate-binding protein